MMDSQMRRTGSILAGSLLAITCNHPVEVWTAKKIVAMVKSMAERK
jgi:hypothetical protein